MARLDVFKSKQGEYLLDFQADILSHLNTRFVIPLASPSIGPKIVEQLNPVFDIDGESLALYTQFALTVPVGDLQHHVTSLADEHFRIMDALDMLISGY